MLRIALRRVLAAALAVTATFSAGAQSNVSSPRLYVLDGGVLKSETARYRLTDADVEEVSLTVASFLIVHPRGTLQFDSGGIPDSQFKNEGELVTEGVQSASKRLLPQLASAGYRPSDITYFALSHYHADHTGNANAFANSTWITQKAERADAALYWKAFAQFKLARTDDALATITQLRHDYAQSRYLTDAKVLEADARKAAGQPVNPSAADDEEIKLLMAQGAEEGVFEPTEQAIVSNVLRLDDRYVGAILTPRADVTFVDVTRSWQENARVLAATPHAVIPVCRGGLDEVTGVVRSSAILGHLLKGEAVDLQ